MPRRGETFPLPAGELLSLPQLSHPAVAQRSARGAPVLPSTEAAGGWGSCTPGVHLRFGFECGRKRTAAGFRFQISVEMQTLLGKEVWQTKMSPVRAAVR